MGGDACLRFCGVQGSAKSGILGEVVLDLAEFAGRNQMDQRALPLQKCIHGTVLHVRGAGGLGGWGLCGVGRDL